MKISWKKTDIFDAIGSIVSRANSNLQNISKHGKQSCYSEWKAEAEAWCKANRPTPIPSEISNSSRLIHYSVKVKWLCCFAMSKFPNLSEAKLFRDGLQIWLALEVHIFLENSLENVTRNNFIWKMYQILLSPFFVKVKGLSYMRYNQKYQIFCDGL